MAFTTVYSNGQRANMVREFVVDIQADITSINTSQLLPGSTCFVIEESQWYMLNHNLEWKPVQISGISGDVIYDGGEENSSSNNQHLIYDGGEEQ